MTLQPKYLFLTLQRPAKIHLGASDWDITGQVRLQGVPVEGNDTPWLALADLLVDRQGGYFVGLTFAIDDQQDWKSMKMMAEELDPAVVHYNEISTPEAHRMYEGEAGKTNRFEITWARARTVGFEPAQLCCGQWFWWYDKQDWTQRSFSVVALGLSGIDEILTDHKLKFPQRLEFPRLEVAFVNENATGSETP